MSFGDVLRTLQFEGFEVTICQLRWAVDSKKISTPLRDEANHLHFGTRHLNELRTYFGGKKNRRLACQALEQSV